MNPKLSCITVKTPQEKVVKICELAADHLSQKTPLYILVADQKSFDFVDKILWEKPPSSFLPHPSSLLQIVFQAEALDACYINLKPEPLLLNNFFKTIYEFEDLSSAEKKERFKSHYSAYKESGFSISSK